jgi:sacsin
LSGFSSLLPRSSPKRSFLSCFSRSSRSRLFPGSIIRLPLRTAPSNISTKPVDVLEIRQLLLDFVDKEIRISLLFLEHIASIEVVEIDAHGQRLSLALSRVSRSIKLPRPIGTDQNTTFTCLVETSTDGSPSTSERWRVQNTSFSPTDATSCLSQRAECDCSDSLLKHKLRPDVGLAIPLSILEKSEASGRLYTYLPLPLSTGFPLHIHSLFALTQSRQNLRNREEKGVMRGSDDR